MNKEPSLSFVAAKAALEDTLIGQGQTSQTLPSYQTEENELGSGIHRRTHQIHDLEEGSSAFVDSLAFSKESNEIQSGLSLSSIPSDILCDNHSPGHFNDESPGLQSSQLFGNQHEHHYGTQCLDDGDILNRYGYIETVNTKEIMIHESVPLKKAVAEHVDHDHNLARNPLISVTTPPNSVLASSDNICTQQEQIALPSEQMYLSCTKDPINELLLSNSISNTKEPSLQQLIFQDEQFEEQFSSPLQLQLQNSSDWANPISSSSEPEHTNSEISNEKSNTDERGEEASQESEVIEVITIDDTPSDPQSSQTTLASNIAPQKLKKPSLVKRSLDIGNTSRTITVPINGISVEVQRFLYNNSLCRVCLLLKEYLISLYEDISLLPDGSMGNSRGPNASSRYNIISALKTLLDIDVKYDDGLPLMICIDCVDNLMSFSAFRKRIGVGQNRLLEVLAQVKNSLTPTMIPSLGEEDNQKSEVYRYPNSVMRAKKVLGSSSYSHLVVRHIPDKIWEKIFTSMVGMVGFKSGKLKELEPYVMDTPFVQGWFCNICNLTFPGSQEVYTQHFLNCHEIKSVQNVKFPCDICGGRFYKTQTHDCHEIEETYSVHWMQHFFFHVCDICNKKMPSIKSIWVHKRSAHSSGDPVNECELCHKKFKNKSHLIAHKKIHLKPEERKALSKCKCPICEKSLIGSISAHVASAHSVDRPWKCEVCSKRFKRKETLQNHRSIVHASPIISKFKCGYCAITLKTSSSRNAHERRHNGEKSHKCNQCSQSFFTRSALSSHQISHKEVGDIPCSLCDKKFKRKMYLTEHMRTHSEEMPFECPICKRRIRIRANYYKHLKVHEKNGVRQPKPNNRNISHAGVG